MNTERELTEAELKAVTGGIMYEGQCTPCHGSQSPGTGTTTRVRFDDAAGVGTRAKLGKAISRASPNGSIPVVDIRDAHQCFDSGKRETANVKKQTYVYAVEAARRG